MMMSINLKILSIDSFDTEIIENVSAHKKLCSGDVHYFYQSNGGDVELLLSDNSFNMSRSGEGNIKIYFMDDGVGEFILDAYGVKNTLLVKNGKINNTDKKKEIFYELYQGDEMINSLNIMIYED